MRIRRFKATVTATAVVTAIALTACTGLPDKSFGAAGVTSLPSISNLEGGVTALPNGKTMAVGFIPNSASQVVFRFNGNGTVDTAYAKSGRLSVGIGQVFITSDGRTYVFTSAPTATRLTAYTPAGTADPTFGAGGIDLPPNVTASGVSPAGEIYLWSCSSVALQASCSLHRYDKAGRQDPAFVDKLPKDTYGQVVSFGASGSVFVVSYLEPYRVEPSRYVLTKLTHVGTPDVAFGNHGSVALPATVRVNSVIVDPAGRATMLADVGTLALVLRFTPQGHGDTAFGWLGMAAIPPLGDFAGSMAVDSTGRVILTASNSSDLSPVRVVRYLATGRLDPTFGYAGTATLSQVGTTSLLNMFVVGVATDSANRPVVSLDADLGMAQSPAPALLRLTS